MRHIVLFMISILYGLVNLYIGNRIANLMKPYFSFNISLVVGIPLLCLTISSILAHLQPTRNWGIIGTIGIFWFAFVVLALAVFGVSDIILFLISTIRRTELSTNITTVTRMINIALVLILFFIGMYTANDIKITKYEIAVDKSSNLDMLKIAMFSDLHLGYVNNHEKLSEIVSKINRISPDIVVIPGDFFDGNYNAIKNPQEIQEALLKINSTYGTYLVWGNHDAGNTFDEMKALIASANITILEDEAIEVADRFILVGRRDSSPIGYQGENRTDTNINMEESDINLPVIVLDHQPSNMDEYQQADLILSGHTHQGQVFPFSLITKLAFIVDYGYYCDDKKQMIVTSGVATWGPPIRIGTKSEIVEIDMGFLGNH